MTEAMLLRFAPYVIALVAIAWLIMLVVGWKHDSERLQVVDKEFAVYRQGVEVGARVRKEVSDEYHDEIAKLHADADAAPPRSVRLCVNPAVPGTTGAPGGDHGPAATAGILSQGTGQDPRPGPDIGPGLYGKADKADEVSAQLRACQAFVTKLQHPTK